MSIVDQIKAFFMKLLVVTLVLILGAVIKDELVGYALLIISFVFFAARILAAAEERKDF